MPAQQDSISLYRRGVSPLHKLHPFNKLAYVLLTGTAVYCAPGGWMPDAALLAANLLLAAVCGILPGVLNIAWRTLLPLALFMLPIHGFLYPANHTVLYAASGLTLYLEGVQFAGTILLQLAAILTSSLLVVLTTHPGDFITALTRAGWPPSLAYVFGSPLLMLPAMRTRIHVIQAAQRARGLDTEGNMLKRLRFLPSLVAPFVLGAFAEIDQRAIALELRGFRSPGAKTALRLVPDSPLQQAARWLLLCVSVLFVIYRVAA